MPSADRGVPIKYLLISTPRSATNELGLLLDSNENITYLAEAFHPHGVHLGPGLEYLGSWTPAQRDQDRKGFADMLFTRTNPKKPHTKAQGFKIFPGHLTEAELRALTEPKHVKKIVMQRVDTVAQFVSDKLAHASGDWERHRSDATMRVVLNATDVLRHRDKQKQWFRKIWELSSAHPASWLFLETEDVLRSPQGMIKIYAHLDLAQGPPMPYAPYDHRPLRDKIANYDEIREVLGLE